MKKIVLCIWPVNPFLWSSDQLHGNLDWREIQPLIFWQQVWPSLTQGCLQNPVTYRESKAQTKMVSFTSSCSICINMRQQQITSRYCMMGYHVWLKYDLLFWHGFLSLDTHINSVVCFTLILTKLYFFHLAESSPAY